VLGRILERSIAARPPVMLWQITHQKLNRRKFFSSTERTSAWNCARCRSNGFPNSDDTPPNQGTLICGAASAQISCSRAKRSGAGLSLRSHRGVSGRQHTNSCNWVAGDQRGHIAASVAYARAIPQRRMAHVSVSAAATPERPRERGNSCKKIQCGSRERRSVGQPAQLKHLI